MGISLTGLTPSTTYDALIKVGDNGPIDGTLKVLSDGDGNNLPMEVSTTGVNFTNNLTQGGTALQPVLVSGTNIKTINGASLLGSGNIPVVTSPSGVSGAIQFSDGSAFSSDATKFFWDNTNKRLGLGLNNPTNTFEIASTSASPFKVSTTASYFRATFQNAGASGILDFNSSNFQFPTNSVDFGTSTALGARVGIKGSGSTSATTSLLVQNSAGASSLQVTDDGSVFNYGKSAIVDNTAFGRLTLNSNTTGSQNAAYGFEALKANTTGSINAAFGDKALLNNSTGQRNSAFGARSLYTNQGGNSNSAFGNQALLNNTLGNQNCGMGLNALLANETGSDNSAYGVSALSSNTTGSDNSALGASAQSGNFSGSVILGKGATATASNQFVVGSSTTNAGAVNSTSDVPATFLWTVRINGTNYKILMTT